MTRDHSATAPDASLRGLDDATMDSPRARRNLFVGLWAARRMGLNETDGARYALSLMAADYAEPGDSDVLRKLSSDLAASGHPADDAELRAVLTVMQSRAYVEIRSAYL